MYKRQVECWYGETYTLGEDAEGLADVVWGDRNGHTGIEAPDWPPPFTYEDLALAYEYADADSDGNVTVPKDNFDVNVKVLKDGEELPSDVAVEYSVTCLLYTSRCV